MKENWYGIRVGINCLVAGNKIVNNTGYGIQLTGMTGITIRDNHLMGNGKGIDLYTVNSINNAIYWNNFINNTDQIYFPATNIWHGLWNITGNYWSDYTCNTSDTYKIGDDPYVIDENNVDNFPFMSPYLPGDVIHDGKVDIFDVVVVSSAYGSHGPPDPSQKWNPHADLNEDNKVDMKDIAIVTANYLKTWQDYWDK